MTSCATMKMIQVNDKEDPPYLQKKQIRSNLKSRYNGCTRASNNPAFYCRKHS
ncbi:MAG: hypothetical protein ACLTEE_02130 [Anaerobutyricum hallii]